MAAIVITFEDIGEDDVNISLKADAAIERDSMTLAQTYAMLALEHVSSLGDITSLKINGE